MADTIMTDSVNIATAHTAIIRQLVEDFRFDPCFASLEQLCTGLKPIYQYQSWEDRRAVSQALDEAFNEDVRSDMRGAMDTWFPSSWRLNNNALILRALPIWPLHGSPGHFVTGQVACFNPHKAMFPSWARPEGRFIEPKIAADYVKALRSIGVKEHSDRAMWLLIKDHVPEKLDSTDKLEEHARFLKRLSQSKVNVTHVAPDAHGKLREHAELFSTGNVHKRFFKYDTYNNTLHIRFAVFEKWLGNHGFHYLGENLKDISPATFVELAKVVDQQFRNTKIFDWYRSCCQELGKVFQASEVNSWNWSKSQIDCVKTRRIFEVSQKCGSHAGFRKKTLVDRYPKGRNFVALEDAVPEKYYGISWTIRPRLRYDPPISLWEQASLGEPPVTQVLHHLQNMLALRKDVNKREEKEVFMADIQQCYQFLQDHDEEVAALNDVESLPIWMNISSVDFDVPIDDRPEINDFDFQNNVESAKDLCDGVVWPHPGMKELNSFLAPFKIVLFRVGFQYQEATVGSDTVTFDGPRPPPSKYSILRRNGEHCDYNIRVGNMVHPVHRFILAACSDYFEINFQNTAFLQTNQSDFVFGCGAGVTFEKILRFMYDEWIDWPKAPTDRKEADGNLKELTDLIICAEAWQMHRLKALVEEYIGCSAERKAYIRPDNVEQVLDFATTYRASILKEKAEEFLEINAVLMDRMTTWEIEWSRKHSQAHQDTSMLET